MRPFIFSLFPPTSANHNPCSFTRTTSMRFTRSPFWGPYCCTLFAKTRRNVAFFIFSIPSGTLHTYRAHPHPFGGNACGRLPDASASRFHHTSGMRSVLELAAELLRVESACRRELHFFTYGPLGFTLMPQAIGNNVAIGLICTAGYAFCYMFTFFAFVRYCPCSKQGLWCLLLCMVFLPANEWRWSVLILFILLLCAHIPCNTRYLLVCLSFLLGVIIVYSSLLKFTLAITSVLCVTITVLHIAVFSKKKLLIFLPVLVVTLALGFLFASLTLFSTPSDLLKWMNVSWEIASGYNTAMVTQVSMIEIQLPLFLMASYLFAVVPARKTNRERIALIALVSPLVFFSLKYSITRAGIGNCRAIAYVFPFVTAMLITCADLQWRPRLIRLFAFQFVVSVALFVISGIAYQTPVCGFSFKNFFSTLNIRKSYQTAKAESEQALLPLRLPHDWRIAIGTNTFSSFPTELTYVPANGLNFVSFPIIQGYSAYTRKLDRLGARLYESENAPTWVLCEFAKTDQRNGMIDTPAVWNAIMTRYQFADSMNNLCLMEKKKTSIPSKIKPVQTIVIKQGARLNISKDNEHTLYMSVHWPQSLIGKIISLVFRNTFCSINLERENGQSQRWRLTPDTAQTPFSLDDIPFDDNDFRMILSGTAQSMLRIKSVLFACDWPSFYSETITVTIYRAEHHSANSICLGSECVVKSHKTHPCLGSP